MTPGAPLVGGAPGFILFDPLRHLFFQLGGLEQRIVSLWRLRDPEAIRSRLVAEGETEEDSPAAIEDFHRFAAANDLLREPDGDTAALFTRRHAARHRGWWHWLVEHYLFIRVPLVRPAAFLARTLPVARRIWSTAGIAILALLGLAGLFLATREWDAFADNLSALLNGEGLLAYAVALAAVKCMHEAGHAYTATRFGCRVPTMGISFLVMFPVLYTDTSGAWRLRSRRQRLWIDAAGVLAELSVAAVALFLWCFLPDGPMLTAAFVLATTSLATSLLVNASPFMRYDGYYLLSDAIGVPNHAPRAFAMMRWRLREALFALGEPPPEDLPARLRTGLVAYGCATFVYRTMLYVGIALLVYHKFFKALGIALFIVEVAVFLARPVLSELREWRARRAAIAASPRARWIAAAAMLGIVAALLPIDRSMSLPAVLAPIGDQAIVTGDPARVERILVRNGEEVAAGQPLIELSSPEIELGEAQARLRIALLASQIARGAADREDLADQTVLHRDLVAQRDALAGFARRRAALSPRAVHDGRVVDLPRDLAPGMWIDGKAPLMRVVTTMQYDVRGYAPDSAGWRMIPGVVARFVPDDGLAASWRARLDETGSAAVSTLDQPGLASTNGGPIAVEKDPEGKTMVPKRPLIVLHLVAEQGARAGFPQPMIGRVIVPVRGDSLAAKLWRDVGRVLARETSLQ